MKITWWIAALVGLAIAAFIWPPSAGAEDYNKMFKERREARKGITFEQHMDKYNKDIEAANRQPINNIGALAPKRKLKTPQNLGKKCGSRNRR